MKVSSINFSHTQNLKSSNIKNKKANLAFYGQITPDLFKKTPIDYAFVQKYKGKIEAIFADIDGTLSKSNNIVTKRTIDAAEILEKQSIPLILTTARTYADTKIIIDKLRHKPQYSIVLGGASIIDKNGSYITKSKISQDSASKLINWFKKAFENNVGSHLVTYFDDKTYCTSDFKFPWDSEPIIKTDNFSKLLEQSTMQKAILFTDNKDIKSSKDILKMLKVQGISDFRVDGNVSGGYEFQSANVSKRNAIKHVLKLLKLEKLEPQKTMAIGDSSNDIEMLEYIKNSQGLAVAMGNANQNVKSHSNFITDDVISDGFAQVIENLFA